MLEFAHFDWRRYPTVSAREGYGEWVPSYETTVEDEMDLVLLDALESVPWKAVEHAADLGCGTGRTRAWLRARGVPRLDGVDLTPEMLAIARARKIYDHLVQADVGATGLVSGEYDLVTTCLVEEHLRRLAPALPRGVALAPAERPVRARRLPSPLHHDDPDADPLRSCVRRVRGDRDVRAPHE